MASDRMIMFAMRGGDTRLARQLCAEAVAVGVLDGAPWVREMSSSTIATALNELPRQDLAALVRDVERSDDPGVDVDSCPVCRGDGEVSEHRIDHETGDYITVEGSCPRCRGGVR